jgi:hypothetical protein
MNRSHIDPALLDAFRSTHYVVLDGDLPFVLRIGVASRELSSCHWRFGVQGSAFITAYNPWSVRREEMDNRRAQDRLAESLAARRLATLPGISRDPEGRWPDEPSLLVLGVDLPTARKLGQGFQQNALVFTGADAVPELLLLR